MSLPDTIQTISPLTGAVTTYIATIQNLTVNHQSAIPATSTIVDSFNSGFLAQNVDAFCSDVTIVQGPITDTFQPRVYAASNSPIAPVIALAIMAILRIVLAAIIVIGAIYVISALKELIYGNPKQYWVPGVTVTGPLSWEEYVSYQNAHFWYVCSKDGAGFGSKATYASISDVPATEVAAYHDHCVSAPDISPGTTTFTSLAIIVGGTAILLAGVYFALKLSERGQLKTPEFLRLPKLPRGRG